MHRKCTKSHNYALTMYVRMTVYSLEILTEISFQLVKDSFDVLL
jgi:hypothetical protein